MLDDIFYFVCWCLFYLIAAKILLLTAKGIFMIYVTINWTRWASRARFLPDSKFARVGYVVRQWYRFMRDNNQWSENSRGYWCGVRDWVLYGDSKTPRASSEKGEGQ